jgi:two-component system sensor histidine kinase TctE
MQPSPTDTVQGLALPAPSPGPAPVAPPRGEGSRQGEARSLFGEILDWMFAPLLLLWPMSVTLTYLVAQSIASSPYDHALIERGEALAAHVRFDGGHARFELTPGVLDIYGNGVGESGTYLIVDAAGVPLAGDADLPRAHPPLSAAGRPVPNGPAGDPLNGAFALRDDTLRGHPVRVAYAWLAAPAAGSPAPAMPSAAVLVEVAEAPTERTQLANEIVKGVILPQFIVLPLALLLVWFGLTRGLAPLARLQKTIRNRPPDDLSPIGAEGAPEELTPLLASFNDLLARMTRNLAVQRRFIADAAHQMKTPLAGLRTQAELAQRGGDAQELQRSLRQIAASTERATRLVNQMLALARAEHDAGSAAPLVTVDLDRLARAVVQDWVAPALAQHIDLGYEGPDGNPDGKDPATDCRIRGAPVALREMLNNLIDNALRYTAAPGGIDAAAVRAHATHGVVTVRVRRDGGAVTLEVEDTGPGIPPEERAQVFERFYRILGSRQDGSGLGLAIVREIAVQHGASIGVGPPAQVPAGPGFGPGTRFCVRFEDPIEASAHATRSAARSV